jgi:hypothetical protein
MLRNFIRRNIWLLRPIRIWLKKIGPRESTFTDSAIRIQIGMSVTSAQLASITSKLRFTKRSNRTNGPLAMITVGVSPCALMPSGASTFSSGMKISLWMFAPFKACAQAIRRSGLHATITRSAPDSDCARRSYITGS